MSALLDARGGALRRARVPELLRAGRAPLLRRDARAGAPPRPARSSGIGVGKGTHVALMLPNLSAYPVTWLALATLGAVMVPVNNRYTARELRVRARGLPRQVPGHPPGLLPGDRCRRSPSGADEGGARRHPRSPAPRLAPPLARSARGGLAAHSPRRPPAPAPDDLLNIQYTSGTTGFPKGCMLSQRYWTLRSGHVNARRRSTSRSPGYSARSSSTTWIPRPSSSHRPAHGRRGVRRGSPAREPLHGMGARARHRLRVPLRADLQAAGAPRRRPQPARTRLSLRADAGESCAAGGSIRDDRLGSGTG